MPGHASVVETLDGLAAILERDVNLAIWRAADPVRTPDASALSAIEDVAITLEAAAIGRALLGVLATAGYAPMYAAPIAADIARLGRCVARIADCTSVDIRLEVVETDACRKFHADYVGVRLICTYVGAGTQWLTNDDAARLRRGVDAADLAIRALATGDVAIFKGRLWSEDAAIVHRSPPIAGTGARRLVLVIDPARAGQPDFDRA
ncbi:MAG TPA: DUF1826 domain-containing protein [Sphingomonas sp.]|nr:DUF1826 domain-containing protein [Sphingomonas sp.]